MEINKIYIEQTRQLEKEMKHIRRKTPFEKAKDQFDKNSEQLDPTDAAFKTLMRNRQMLVEGTCNWIFTLEEYESWRTIAESSLLWVSGVGVLGKSILMSAVIDRFQAEFAQSTEYLVQYFFCAQSDDATRVAIRIKEQLLHQLYKHSDSDEFPDLLEKSNKVVLNFLGQKSSTDAKAGTRPQKSLENTLTFTKAYPSLAQIFNKKVFLIIDSLDECTDRVESQLLKTLQGMLSDSKVPLKIMICNHPKSDIVDDLDGSPIIKVEDHNRPDIETAAISKLKGLALPFGIWKSHGV